MSQQAKKESSNLAQEFTFLIVLIIAASIVALVLPEQTPLILLKAAFYTFIGLTYVMIIILAAISSSLVGIVLGAFAGLFCYFLYSMAKKVFGRDDALVSISTALLVAVSLAMATICAIIGGYTALMCAEEIVYQAPSWIGWIGIFFGFIWGGVSTTLTFALCRIPFEEDVVKTTEA